MTGHLASPYVTGRGEFGGGGDPDDQKPSVDQVHVFQLDPKMGSCAVRREMCSDLPTDTSSLQ